MSALLITENTCDNATSQPKNYNGIDLIKFLCSILVFIIHIPPFQGEVSGLVQYLNYGLQHYICRLAVPFFFVCSGFFLYRKMSIYILDIETIKKYCFKILRLFGIWRVLLFFGGTSHLWYLCATVVAVTFISLCLCFCKNFSFICVLTCILYIFGLLGDTYNGLVTPLTSIPVVKHIFDRYELIFGTTRNGIFMGSIFVLMGAFFAEHKVRMKPLTAVIGFAISMLLLLAEIGLLFYYNLLANCNMYIFLVPAVYFLFCFAYTIELKDHAAYKHLRNVGILFYFLHLFVNEFISLLISDLGKIGFTGMDRYQFIFSFAITLLLSVCLERLSCKQKFKWLSWLLT